MDVPGRAANRGIRHCHPRRATRRPVIARKPPTDPPAKRKKSAPRKPARPTLTAAQRTPGTARKKAAVAGPKPSAAVEAPPRRRVHKPEPNRLDTLQAVIVDSLESDKAEDVVSLDLAGRASFCDRMVIATGLADRQITAMATHLLDKLTEQGLKRIQVEGAGGSDWVLVDAGDIVVHLFKPEARALYALERMWGADLDEPMGAPEGGSAA
jgi:ribosome-associated protein